MTMSTDLSQVTSRRSADKPTRVGLVIIAASVPMFAVSMNNLVVTNALPAISRTFFADQTQLQWVVNSYILAFAGPLLIGAALGDRYGRRLVFLCGVLLFTVGSVWCALADSGATLIAARVVQGAGAAAVQPLSLALVAGTAPEHKRSVVIGLWGGVNGLGVALGPLVGGAVTEGMAWQWIFWINVPICLLVLPLVLMVVPESGGNDQGLDLLGMVLATSGVTVAVWAIVHADGDGWTSPRILSLFSIAAMLMALFVLWERRTSSPLLPLRFYRAPTFVLSNFVSLAMFFGVFGSIFFLAQYMQGPLGFSPLEAGLRTLPWTAMPMIVGPLVGLIVDRVGGGRLMALGLAMQGGALAWLASIVRINMDYSRMVPALAIAGIGMGLVFAPTMTVVLSSVQQHEYGKASGANNTIREIGGALGVAVLVTVFHRHFVRLNTLFPLDVNQAFVDGMVSAMRVGVIVVMLGAFAALFIRRPRKKGIL